MKRNKEPNKIVIALDNEVNEGFDLVDQIENNTDIKSMIYGYKASSLWILEYGLEVLKDLYFDSAEEHIVILDMQKWPTDTPAIVTKQVNKIIGTNSVDELIACPMGGGRKSFEAFVQTCKENTVRPLCVLEMTHPESNFYLGEMYHMKILQDAATFEVDGFIIPATKEPRQEIKTFLDETFPNLQTEFYATGFDIQEGHIKPMRDFGVSKYIIGREIYEAEDPEQAIMDIYKKINQKG